MAAVLLLILFSGCRSSGDDQGSDRLSVVASTSILAALASEVGGDAADVETLIGSGVDPHTFELTPGDIRTVAGADVIVVNGLGLDDYLLDDIERANDSALIIVATDGIELIETDDHDHEPGDDHEHDGNEDPHVWQDPLRVKMMVGNISEGLADADPTNAEKYRDNAATYRSVLDDADRQIQTLIDQIPEDDRRIVTNHDAFGYFADRYGLEIVGTVIPGSSAEADSSAGDIAKLAKLIDQQHVRAIFAETLIDPKVAERLAADTGVEIIYGLYTDQVGQNGTGAETVHGMLLANAEKISEALR